MRTGLLVALALILGLGGGLAYAWVLDPVEIVDTYPPLMQARYRADWITMTAFAYGSDGDLDRAQVRLRDLPDDEVRRYLSQALGEAIAGGQPLPVLERMAALARRYGVDNPAVDIYTGSGGERTLVPGVTASPSPIPTTSTPTQTPTPTLSPTPSPSPTATPVPPSPTPTIDPELFSPLPTPTPRYLVIDRLQSCLPEPSIAISLTEQVSVTVRGRERSEIHGVPGVEVWLTWEEGSDRAVTGFRPNQGLGYADFTVIPETAYNLYLESATGVPLATFHIAPCGGESDDPLWDSWLLIVRYNRE